MLIVLTKSGKPPGKIYQRSSQLWSILSPFFRGFTKTRGHDRVGNDRRALSLTISKNSFSFVDLCPKLSKRKIIFLSSAVRRNLALCVWSFETRPVHCRQLWIVNGNFLHNRFLLCYSFIEKVLDLVTVIIFRQWIFCLHGLSPLP